MRRGRCILAGIRDNFLIERVVHRLPPECERNAYHLILLKVKHSTTGRQGMVAKETLERCGFQAQTSTQTIRVVGAQPPRPLELPVMAGRRLPKC